jgi:hypothetical protein
MKTWPSSHGFSIAKERTTEEEMSTEERRAPGAIRMPFDALVEVGGALGPTFEAQAVNVSEDGIQLRTAYLPEAGQTLTCRFDAGPGHNVLASGEVVWAQGGDEGGEFAVRFTDVDPESIDALKGICGVRGDANVQAGSKVRLHIDGLASPMRAKIREAQSMAVTVGSELGFLQVGRPLELEDTQSGKKRPANINRVDVVVDPASQVPQLVVTLRYSDAPASVEAPRAPSPVEIKTEREAHEEPSEDIEIDEPMKSAFARSMAAVGPALNRVAQRAKTTMVLLAKRPTSSWEDRSSSRRTTAPPPGGGLHTTGRRVVRGEAPSSPTDASPTAALKGSAFYKHRTLLAGVILAGALAGAFVLKKTRHEIAQAPSPAAAPAATVAVAPVPAPAPPSEPTPQPTSAAPVPSPATTVATADEAADPTKAEPKHHVHVTPFSNGPVHHGNILRLKMDAPLESIEGAQQPTGFTVKVPGRKSLEAAGPLAARDSRIAGIKVTNDEGGAELSVVFKDGVPNYRVSAKGDSLVIALAPPGATDESGAKKDDKTDRVAKRTKHTHGADNNPRP